jgi:hypothetical protein
MDRTYHARRRRRRQEGRLRIRTGAALATLVVALAGAPAAAVAAPTDTKARKVIRLEAIQIEGRIQKPQAFYILQRSNLNIEILELKESFIPKIIRSVEGDPF